MEKTDLRTLQILEEINVDGQLSQRRLAGRLGISLGPANSFVRRLANKGYFKIVNTTPNRFAYVLTPKGFSEKARLSYQYINYSYRFYRDARRRLQELFLGLERAGLEKIVFAGVSDFAEIAYLSLQETTLTLTGVIDKSDGRKNFFGYHIRIVDEIIKLSYDRVLITALENRKEMSDLVTQRGVVTSSILIP